MSEQKKCYIALLRDTELTCDEILSVQTDKKELERQIFDYFGISETKEYAVKDEYLGYTKIEFDHGCDTEGYHSFKDELGNINKVFVIIKQLNEKIK